VGWVRSVVLAVLGALAAGCAGGGPTAPAASAPATSMPAVSVPASSAPATGPPAASSPGRPTKSLTIVEENHGEQAALARMPYLASLAAEYGRTTDYRALAHPSLPNYLALVGGSTLGVTDDGPPAIHHVRGPSVFGQALAAGRTAKAYAESMDRPCELSNSGSYAVRHNPWTYFADPAERTACQAYDVPAGTPSAGTLHDDVAAGTLPTIGWITPNLCHDAHDCALGAADDWLRGWLPAIMAGPDFRAGRLAIDVTFDEDEGESGNTVLTVVIAPGVRHVLATAPCSHYCWTRYADDLAGAPPLNRAAGAPSLGAAFGLG
jgi:phosphatidylinositol-3-phosphatase